MKRRAFLAAPLLLVALPALGQTEMDDPFKGALPDTKGVKYELGPDLDTRVVDIAKDLGCICGTCPHEPVSSCTCSTAKRIRAEIALGISQNKDKDAILGMVVNRFGETVLPKPPFSGLNLVAWLGPFVVMGGAAFWIRGIALKKWQAKAAQKQAAAPAPAKDAEPDPYLAAVDAEIRARGGL